MLLEVEYTYLVPRIDGDIVLYISVLLTTHYKRLFPHTYESGRSGSDRPSQIRERRQHYITQPNLIRH
jgi:hypothetical protein